MSSGVRSAPFNQQDNQLAAVRRASNIRSYGVIKGIMGNRVVDSLPLRVRCECAIPTCEEIIEVTLFNRRELRRNHPRGFIVVRLHANSPQDTMLYENDDFSVVEKPQFTETVTDL